MVASTATRFAAVAAQFPELKEAYTKALCELASVKPMEFRMKIAMDESFFEDLAKIWDAHCLQAAQVTLCEDIEALFLLKCGQSLEIPMGDVANQTGLPPRDAQHGTSAVAAIQILRLGFRGNVCEDRRSVITGRVEPMVYVAWDDETALTYAGNRESGYCPEYISEVGPPIKLCVQVRCPDGQVHVSLKRGGKKYGGAWLAPEVVPVGIIIECLGNQPVLLPEEFVQKRVAEQH